MSQGETKIIIDATSRILYASYYIKGLYEVFGKQNISFSTKEFKDLKRASIAFSFEHYFAFMIIQPNETQKRIVIDFCDPPEINKTAYLWCDIYAKINFNPKQTDSKYLNKIVLIPPGFGIRIWNTRETFYHCIHNLLKSGFLPIIGYKRYLKDYYRQYKRPPIQEYFNINQSDQKNSKPYVFIIGTLWGENGEKTNRKRKRFIELIIAKNCAFEGGFLINKNSTYINQYKEFSFKVPYSSSDYISKTKQSDFVFNTPAVHNCNGWKLAEFLAMGKAIISTPLSNEIPSGIEQGINIHFVHNEEELENTIDLFINNPEYRIALGENAYLYFKNVVSPKAVINQIIKDH